MYLTKSFNVSVLFEGSVLLVLSSCPSVGKLDAPTLAAHIDEFSLTSSFHKAFTGIEEAHSECSHSHLKKKPINTEHHFCYFTKGRRRYVCSCLSLSALGSSWNIYSVFTRKYADIILKNIFMWLWLWQFSVSRTWCQHHVRLLKVPGVVDLFLY